MYYFIINSMSNSMSNSNELCIKNYLNNLESKINIKNRLDFRNKKNENEDYIPLKNTYNNSNYNKIYNYKNDLNSVKTKLCRSVYVNREGIIENDCKYGVKCNFAHNFNELNINCNKCHFNKRCKNIEYYNNYFYNKKSQILCDRIHEDETKFNYCHRIGKYAEIFNKFYNIKFEKNSKYKTYNKYSEYRKYHKYRKYGKLSNFYNIKKKINKNNNLSLSERDELKLLRFCIKEKIHL